MAIEPLSDREQQLAAQVAELKRELAATREALARASHALKGYEHDQRERGTCTLGRGSIVPERRCRQRDL
jgi:hypothetical protein